jgi:ABC-type Na+ efflux pump permease subunit
MSGPLILIAVSVAASALASAALGMAGIRAMATDTENMEHVYGTLMPPMVFVGIIATAGIVIGSIAQFAH